MPFRVPECFRRLHRHRNQQQGDQSHARQSHADSTTTCLQPNKSQLDSVAPEHHRQQQAHTDQPQHGQQPFSSSMSGISSSVSQSGPPSAAGVMASNSPLSAAMLGRAPSHRGAAGQPPIDGPLSDVGTCSPALQPQLSESRLPTPHFSVYVWGLNDCGQLMSAASPADGEKKGAAPSSIAKLENKSVCGCCLGLDRTWVWDVGQSVWAGGNNEGGCIDPEGDDIISKPRLTEGIRNALCVAAGEGHTIAILENGCKCTICCAGFSSARTRASLWKCHLNLHVHSCMFMCVRRFI